MAVSMFHSTPQAKRIYLALVILEECEIPRSLVVGASDTRIANILLHAFHIIS